MSSHGGVASLTCSDARQLFVATRITLYNVYEKIFGRKKGTHDPHACARVFIWTLPSIRIQVPI
jgi:hypothetical protein